MCIFGKVKMTCSPASSETLKCSHCSSFFLCLLGLKRKPLALIKRLRKAKKEAPPMEKPAVVKTHLRNMIVVPEMIGSVVGIHNGKVFNQVEIKVGSPTGELCT